LQVPTPAQLLTKEVRRRDQPTHQCAAHKPRREQLHLRAGAIVLVASGLRRPDAARAYQVWLLRDGQPRPNALFGVNRAGVGSGIVHVDVPWGTFDTIAVTPEPLGGSPAPTGPIVLAGSLVNEAN
jgi:anti-sigma-K factor RskA